MQKSSPSKPSLSIPAALFLAVSLAMTAAGLLASPSPSGGGRETWVPTGSNGACWGPLVCAEWEDELTIYMCCIDESDLYTSSLDACYTTLTVTTKQRDSP